MEGASKESVVGTHLAARSVTTNHLANIPVTVWSPRDSPRVRFVLDWLLGERLGLQYTLTHDAAIAKSASHCIAYGWIEGAVTIQAGELLWETGMKSHFIQRCTWEGLHTLYFDEESGCDIQFDMLAGIFYLLTRYEEYLEFTPDRHGRYPASKSILDLDGMLERPVIDEWVEALRLFLEQVWNISIPQKPFSFQPTYDIDIAWSYRHKGIKRTLGATFKDLATLNWPGAFKRFRVLRGLEPDPYDSFVWLLMQHMESQVKPIYFILVANAPSAYDKNISPHHPHMASIIRAFAEGASIVGLHPSYYSDSVPGRLHNEHHLLLHTAAVPILHSRQHYIRLRFPGTCRALISEGIYEDWSMGYSTRLGFRAGTGCSFLWYDIEREYNTTLRLHPFAFMDTTAHYDLGLSAEEAFMKLRGMADSLQHCGSSLVTIMHNFSLGTDSDWEGWRHQYERFLNNVARVA